MAYDIWHVAYEMTCDIWYIIYGMYVWYVDLCRDPYVVCMWCVSLPYFFYFSLSLSYLRRLERNLYKCLAVPLIDVVKDISLDEFV